VIIGSPRFYLVVFVVLTVTAASAAIAEDQAPTAGGNAPDRPKISFYRWQEDWSVLADQRLRTGVLDSRRVGRPCVPEEVEDRDHFLKEQVYAALEANEPADLDPVALRERIRAILKSIQLGAAAPAPAP